jgi:hypothetical protein
MKLTFQESVNFLQSADIVKLVETEGFIYVNISFDEVNQADSPNGKCIYVHWEDSFEDCGFYVMEKDNAEVKCEGNILTVMDDSGIETEIALFREVPMKLDSKE